MAEKIVDEMDLSCLYATYSKMGRPPATSAETLLMVMLYACMERKYSSREIESACKRDMNYIRLLNGEEAPNYHEICRFRSERLSLCAEELFYQLVKKLRVIDEIKYEHLFADAYFFVVGLLKTYEKGAAAKFLLLLQPLYYLYLSK